MPRVTVRMPPKGVILFECRLTETSVSWRAATWAWPTRESATTRGASPGKRPVSCLLLPCTTPHPPPAVPFPATFQCHLPDSSSPDCNGNFDDHTPYCAIGLTFDGLAEAECTGTGFGCGAKNVCKYRADGQPDFLPTGPPDRAPVDIKAMVSNTTAPNHDIPPYDYSEALTKLLLFYDSMISGNITGACRRRLTWRSDSCSGCYGKYGEDLTGGFYEAGGSTLKYPSIVSGFAGNVLAWSALEYPDAVSRAGAMDDLKWKVKWAADHVIAAHPQEFVFAGFYGNATDDFDYYGPGELSLGLLRRGKESNRGAWVGDLLGVISLLN